MGTTSYSVDARSTRSAAMSYETAARDDIFTQNAEGKMHEEMNPKDIAVREARDSEAHPNTVPIILGLDVTGSMGHIPHELIKEGLPRLMSGLIHSGVPDAALLFAAIGDHECDRAPLQVGQFESGDAELDMWLTRTWLEGRGGGNAGESYLLAWVMASGLVQTDAWDKRGEKGFLITVGDEPNLPTVPKSAAKQIFGEENGERMVQGGAINREDLLREVQNRWNVFHIHLNHGYRNYGGGPTWDILGDNLITLNDHTELPREIVRIVLSSESINGEFNEEAFENAMEEMSLTGMPGGGEDRVMEV